MINQTHINADQIRAARALLNWSQDDLASASGLSVATIRKIETGHISPRDATMGSIKTCLEDAQVEFTPSSGLRLRDNSIVTLEGDDAYLQVLDDIYFTLKGKKGEALLLYADSSTATEEEVNAALRTRKIGVKWRFLCAEGNTHLHYPLDEYRWVPKKFFRRNIQLIYANKVAMSCHVDQSTNTTTKIIIIESAALADSNRNLFEFMWENCRKPSHSTASKIYS